MSDNTKIEWTDATWNPVTGCSIVSSGCTNCYAMKLAGTRLRHHPSRAGLTAESKAGPVWTGEVRLNEQWLAEPLRWRRPRRIFVCAHGDLFHESVLDEWIDRVFAVMALCPQHVFQVLTKRPERMREYMASIDNGDGERLEGFRSALVEGMAQQIWRDRTGDDTVDEWLAVHLPLPNVWLGTSVEDQRRADERIPHLLATPAAVRFLSCEPLLEAVWPWHELILARANALIGQPANEEMPGLDWIIAGGESGPGARPMQPAWARSLRDQCAAAGVPFFFKQWGEWAPFDRATTDSRLLAMPGATDKPLQRFGKVIAGRLLDGVEHNGMPS